MNYESYHQTLSERLGVIGLPFKATEYDVRRTRVLQRMTKAGIDLLLVTDPADICYLTGYNTFEVSVHTCLSLHANGTHMQVPSIEIGPAVCGSDVDDVSGYRWERPEEILDQLANIIRELCASDNATVGMDSWSASLRVGVLEGLRERLPGARLNNASGLVDAVKIVKSDTELAMLDESARITVAGLDAAMTMIGENVQDGDIAAAGSAAMLQAGGEFMSMQPIVTTGSFSSVIHTNHRRRRVQKGEPVFLEFGSAYHRYTAPMMRTVVVGEPTGEMLEVFDTCQRIVAALKENARPGNSFDEAAQGAERAFGKLADKAFFSGVYGYTVGAQFPPSWIEGSGFIARGGQQRFEENMTFHLPICLRIPGHWGIGFSETIRVTADGGEPIANNKWELTGVN